MIFIEQLYDTSCVSLCAITRVKIVVYGPVPLETVSDFIHAMSPDSDI